MKTTVVYDTKLERLSTFIFNGKVEALGGLVSADANLVYENNKSTKYFVLDITVDATADTETLTGLVADETVSLGDLKKQLDSSYEKLQELVPQGSLQAMNDDDSKNGTPAKSKSGNKGEKVSISAGETINLQLKVTWKENGKKLDKTKWHIYIGEPDFEKRCTYTYLKFKSDVVSVDLGANGYLCIGNELPNNGMLPDIPEKISSFLNGSNSSGKGLESASLAQVDRARKKSLDEFTAQATQNGGGVMFGGQVYGYLDVDLGIFYLYAGATAGFDISLIKLGHVDCTNFDGKAGYKGWYGYGQLYAYLYAKFGIRIDVGFWKKDFDIVDAGVGGMFQLQGPKPSHFEGKARVKLKLLGGLVKVDRRFAFECGQSCDLFYGNALDEFKLFGDLSCGYDNQEQGWNEKNAINPNFRQNPYFTTEAPLNEPFRVLDETEKKRLERNYTGDAANLDMEASRTFIFRSNVGAYVTLEEYSWRKNKNGGVYYVKEGGRTFRIKGHNRFDNYIDIKELNPNRYYKMTVTGYAKEIQQGQEVDPVFYDESTQKHYNKAWSQTKTYYFCTASADTLTDCPENFQDIIAIAYPSHYNQVVTGDKIIAAHRYDVQHPNIAFYSDVSNDILKHGVLEWVLYNTDNKREATTIVDRQDAKWVTSSGNCCNLISEVPLEADAGNFYRLALEYSVAVRAGQRFRRQTTKLVDMAVWVLDSDWDTGREGQALTTYDLPFIGSKINNVTYKYELPTSPISDYDISYRKVKIGKKDVMVADPYWFISYLSNYAFFGGWKFSASRIDENITTAQSLIYTDKGGRYEGRLGTGSDTYNTYYGVKDIRKLSVYTSDQYGVFTQYPLPYMDDPAYNYTLTGLNRIPVYTPGKGNPKRVSGYIKDMYSPALACDSLATWNNMSLYKTVRKVLDKFYGSDTPTNRLNNLMQWYQSYRGQYVIGTHGSSILQIPCYQFPILVGSCLENADTYGKISAWKTLEGYQKIDQDNKHSRGHEKHSIYIMSTLYGKKLGNKTIFGASENSLSDIVRFQKSQDYITDASFSIYRCNTYNYNNCSYGVNSLYDDDSGTDSNNYNYKTFTIKTPLTYYNNYGD